MTSPLPSKPASLSVPEAATTGRTEPDYRAIAAAAELIRKNALAATPSADPRPGGWSGYVMDSGQGHLFGGPAENGYRTGTVFSFSEDCEECGRPTPADMQHISGWHPSVALAVADWLDYCAERASRTSRARLDHDDEERAWFLPALNIARAYLGEMPCEVAS